MQNLGRFSIIYFSGLGLRIRVRVRVWVRVRVKVRVRVRVWVRVRVEDQTLIVYHCRKTWTPYTHGLGSGECNSMPVNATYYKSQERNPSHSCQHGPKKMRDVLLISLAFT